MREHSGLKLNNGILFNESDRGQKDFISLYKKYTEIMKNRGIYICPIKDFKSLINYGENKDEYTIFNIIPYLEKISLYKYIDSRQKDAILFLIEKIKLFQQTIEGFRDSDIVCFQVKQDNRSNIAISFSYKIYGNYHIVKYADIDILTVFKKGRNVNRMLRFFKAVLENIEYSYDNSFRKQGIHNYFETYFMRN